MLRFTCIKPLANLKNINTTAILFQNIGDLKLNRPYPTIHSKNILFDRCHKNFIYFTMYPMMLPSVESIYINGPIPHHDDVLSRFAKRGVSIYITPPYYKLCKHHNIDVQKIPFDVYEGILLEEWKKNNNDLTKNL